MSWLRSIGWDASSGAQKTALALGAFAVAGVTVFRLTRAFSHWRTAHLNFDFPIEEELFIGWGGSSPRRVRIPS